MAPYADTAVRAWERGRQYLSLVDPQRIECALGIQSVLAEWLATEWIGWVNERHPEIALRVESGDSEQLMSGLDQSFIDIAVAFRPRTQPGLKIETFFTDDLILVSSDERALDSSWAQRLHLRRLGRIVPHRLCRRLSGPRHAADPHAPAQRRAEPHPAPGRGRVSHAIDRRSRGSMKEGSMRCATAPFFPIPAFVVYPAEPVDREMQSVALEGLMHIVRHRR